MAESSSNFQEAFTGILDVLNKIGEASPQSKPYGEVLSALMDTIRVYRRQSSYKAHRTADQYIDEILIIDADPNQSGRQPAPTNKSFMNSPGEADDTFNVNISAGELSFVEQSDLDDCWTMQQSWDEVAMQFSDNFGTDFGNQLLKA